MHVAQHQLVHLVHRKRRNRRAVVVRISGHQAAVGALHGDQMDAMREALALFLLQLRKQCLGLRQFAVAVVAHQAQVAHDGCRQLEARLRLHAQHLQLA
ncbi:hypothetical protein D3C72_1561570 [compost metagenome]